jgi:hypothetical protein
MFKFIAIICLGLLSFTSCFSANDLDKTLIKYYQENKVQGKNITVDDYGYVRRLYLDLAGRIPTTDEQKAFVLFQSPDKKTQLIDKLLFSEDYVNNFYNMFADMLRIRPERLSDNTGQLRGYPYMQYVRDSLRSDKPYNVWVTEMLTATGRFTQNPATSYLLRDNGMGLDNLATTMQIFLGKNLACAQCHDDPFQDYSQKQYYELFAFFGNQENRLNVIDYRKKQDDIDAGVKKITGQDRIDNNVRQLLSSNLYSISDDPKKQIRLPHDYQYSDAKPNDIVLPVSLDRKIKTEDNRREKIAEWVTMQPDFANTIANRIWSEIVGQPLVSPIDNFNINDTPEGKILQHLGDVLRNSNYSIKTLIRHIVTSDFYSRISFSGKPDEYNFQSVFLKRMSSYQLWDSILTLVLDDPNYTRINFQEYSKLVELDFEKIDAQMILDRVAAIRKYDEELNKKFLKFKGIDLVRACFLLNRNGFTGIFTKEFGSSDRTLVDASDNQGSISQVLLLMNSPLTELISSSESQLIRSYIKENKNKEVIFMSIMGRLPTLAEKSIIATVDDKDLIWSLVNAREFLFRK